MVRTSSSRTACLDCSCARAHLGRGQALKGVLLTVTATVILIVVIVIVIVIVLVLVTSTRRLWLTGWPPGCPGCPGCQGRQIGLEAGKVLPVSVPTAPSLPVKGPRLNVFAAARNGRLALLYCARGLLRRRVGCDGQLFGEGLCWI